MKDLDIVIGQGRADLEIGDVDVRVFLADDVNGRRRLILGRHKKQHPNGCDQGAGHGRCCKLLPFTQQRIKQLQEVNGLLVSIAGLGRIHLIGGWHLVF